MPEPIRLGLLYAAPLMDENGKPFQLLDFTSERAALFAALREAGRAAEVRVEIATEDSLRGLVTMGVRGLHYVGHGEPDFLAFEDPSELGALKKLETASLRQLCRAGGRHQVELAFVEACYSGNAGAAFVAAGVPHVVAVRADRDVRDDAPPVFARQFYLALGKGQTVREAFEVGRETVRARFGSVVANRFILLPDNGNHDVPLFTDAPRGDVRDVSPPLPPSRLEAVPQPFLGREADMLAVMTHLRTDRAATVRGVAGIGKTELANAVAVYLHQRRVFPDGAFFVSLRGAVSAESVRAAVASALREGGILDYDDVRLPSESDLFRALRDRCFLLVMDNAETPVAADGGNVRDFLTHLLRRVGGVKLQFASRLRVGLRVERDHELHPLDDFPARQMFDANTPRNLTDAELVSDDFNAIMRFLAGHALSIALVASQLVEGRSLHQLRVDLDREKERVAADPSVPEPERTEQHSITVSLNLSLNYLRQLGAEDAIRLFAVMGLLPAGALAEDLDAIWGGDGFSSGATSGATPPSTLDMQQDLSSISGLEEGASPASWRPLMDALVHANLVRRVESDDTTHFTTLPIVTAFAARLLTPDDHELFAVRAGEHFARVCASVYDELGAAFARFDLEEDNLWACLDPARLARRQRDDAWRDPTRNVALYLPRILQLAARLRDTARACDAAFAACRALDDTLGEANTLKALGDLRLRQDELGLALQGYEQALPIYRQIGDRVGEANTLRGIGRLRLAEGDPDAAIEEVRAALEIDEAIGSQLGVGGDYLELGRAAARAGRHREAIEWQERAIGLYRRIQELFSQALALEDEAASLAALNQPMGRCAALWQAREIYRAMGAPQAQRVDARLEQARAAMAAEDWEMVMTRLPAEAETIRRFHVTAILP